MCCATTMRQYENIPAHKRNFQYCNYSLPPHATQNCNVAVAFFAQSKKLTQRGRAQPDSASTYATLFAVAPLDQATICIDFTRFILMFFTPFFPLAESPMAPSTWSGATSRGWSSTTSPTSTRASTNAVRRATSMARSVSPYPIRSHCKLWVSAVYSYVLCTCCCGSAARGRGGGRCSLPQSRNTTKYDCNRNCRQSQHSSRKEQNGS